VAAAREGDRHNVAAAAARLVPSGGGHPLPLVAGVSVCGSAY
jgi:hypothetical protein